MSNRFLPRLPSIDIEARLAVNGVGPTDVGVSIWNTVAHVFYDSPRQFAADFAEYIGLKRDLTEREVAELRWKISEAIAPHDPKGNAGDA